MILFPDPVQPGPRSRRPRLSPEAFAWRQRLADAERRRWYYDTARYFCLRGRDGDMIAQLFQLTPRELFEWCQRDRRMMCALMPTQAEWADFREGLERGRGIRRKRQPGRTRTYSSLPESKRVRLRTAALLNAALRGRTQATRLLARLEYSIGDLRAHLEAQFTYGMSWENYGHWHVDHKKPCALFDHTVEREFKECWGLANLQPLWACENMSKGAQYAGN